MLKRRSPIATLRPVKPSFVLKPERFWEWRCGGEAGREKLAEVLNLAVAELVQEYRLVEQNCASECRRWLGFCVRSHFQRKAIEASRMTAKQARDRLARIEAAGQLLLQEVPIYCGLSAVFDRTDPSFLRLRVEEEMTRFRETLEFVRTVGDFQKALRKQSADNAAKPVLRDLSTAIRSFRVDKAGVVGGKEIVAGSPYVQFASYIFAFVGEPCSEAGSIRRLKGAERDESDRRDKFDALQPRLDNSKKKPTRTCAR